MNRLLYLLVAIVLGVVFTADFFSRIYQPVELNTTIWAVDNVGVVKSEKHIPANVRQQLEQWQQATDSTQTDVVVQTPQIDTGVIGQYQISLLAIYTVQQQRTAVLAIIETGSTQSQMVRISQGNSWQELVATQINAKNLQLTLQNETINLRLFEAASTRNQR